MRIIIIFTAIFLFSLPSKASTLKGAKLVSFCRSATEAGAGSGFQSLTPQEIANAYYCLGYINSVADGQARLNQVGAKVIVTTGTVAKQDPLACVPPEKTSLDLAHIFLQYMKGKDDLWIKAAHGLVRRSLIESFPCAG